MTPKPSPVADEAERSAKAAGYGLRRESLSPMETLAQSVSGACPTLTPFVTVPLVYTLAGNGTWLAYVLGTGGILLVAWCISRFARYSSSPGSLYSYAAMILPPWLAATAAWSLLLAYIMGAASNIGAFYYYANVMLHNATGRELSTLLLSTIFAVPFIWMAWRDVKISARSMLVMETISVTAVVTVMALVLFRHGLHIDPNQLHLHGVTSSGFRQGLVLALYSFVGFEAATTLGSEARNPLKAIPRAVILTAVLGGVFFTICAYAEVLGFGMSGKDLGSSDVPMHVLAGVGGIPVLGLLIDIGALVSLFAGSLAGIIAASRVLLQMSHNGLTHGSLRATHARNETPTGATIVTGLAAFLPVAILAVERYERSRRLWMVGHARSIWIRRELWAGVLCPSGLSAGSSRRGQPGNEDHPVHCMSGDGVCCSCESLSRTGRRVRQAALRLSRLPGRGSFVICVSHARETLRNGGILIAVQDAWHLPSSLISALPGE